MQHMKVRPVRIDGRFAFVTLSQGKETVIDARDVALVDGFNWFAHKNKHSFYAVRNDYTGPKPRLVSIHRTIMGEPDGFFVDHVDGDGLNNCRDNLRLATLAENNRNARKPVTNSSGFKGVSWRKVEKKWQSAIHFEGRKVHLGLFNDLEEAHAAYVAASIKLHGEFGRLA
jgi:hypothetical protein